MMLKKRILPNGNGPFVSEITTINTFFRWGYGWNYGRGYKTMTPAEAAIADEKLDTYMDQHPDPCAELF